MDFLSLIDKLRQYYYLYVTVQEEWEDRNADCECCRYRSTILTSIMELPDTFDLNLVIHDGWFAWYYLGDAVFLYQLLAVFPIPNEKGGKSTRSLVSAKLMKKGTPPLFIE